MTTAPSVKIIEQPKHNDARTALLGMLLFGLLMVVLGAALVAFDQGSGGAEMRWAGVVVIGGGGVLLQIAMIGYGVMLGIHASKS